MILREGYLPIAVATVVVVAAAGTGHLLIAAVALVPLAWLSRVYWERRPPVPANPKGILSPVSGRVSELRETTDPFLDRDVVRIRIRVDFPGIVPVRSPTEGKIQDLFARRGVMGEAMRPCKADESPDCYALWVQTDEGEDVVFSVSSRSPVSRARFEYAPGERVGQGARTGFFYFATFADVLVPASAIAEVETGQRVDAGESVLAELARGQALGNL